MIRLVYGYLGLQGLIMEKEKSVPLQVMFPKSEKEQFVELCKRMDTTASREIRQFVRDYLKKHSQGRLF